MKKTILIILALLLLYGVGVGLRSYSFTARGNSYDGLFMMETAQHARHAKMIGEGQSIPRMETHLQYPNGYDTHIDTIVEEYVAGWIYRLFFHDIRFDIFLRYFIRFMFCLGIFAVYGITREVSGSYWGGLIAATFYAIGMPAIERSMGNTFFREHLAIPLLAYQTWFMVRAFRTDKWLDYIITGILYFIALISWRVLNFYTLILFSSFVLAYLFNYERIKAVKMIGVLTGFIVVGTLIFDVNLRYDAFLLSKQMVIAYAILIVAVFNYKFELNSWMSGGLFLVLTGLLIYMTPATGLYNHVWETMFYQLRYLGQKPADPSVLSFDARHYWVPPYTTPSAFRFLNEMFMLILFASYGLIVAIKRLFQRQLSLSLACLLYLFAAVFTYYWFSYKIKTFVVLFTVVFIGTGFVWLYQRVAENRRGMVIFMVILGLWLQGYQVISWQNSLWIQTLQLFSINPTKFAMGTPLWSLDEALDWINTNTEPDDVFVADITVSPMISYYTNRPTVLHAYFETDIRNRYRELAYAYFETREDSLKSFCQKYQADYLFFTGDVVLKTDPNMSFRYISDNLEFDKSWAAYQLHFQPDSLDYFEVAYQNPFVRIFRCGQDTTQLKELEKSPLYPVFNQKLLQKLSPDDTDLYWEGVIIAYRYVKIGEVLVASKQYDQAEPFFNKALQMIPHIPEAYEGLGKIYELRGEIEKAEDAFRKADQDSL